MDTTEQERTQTDYKHFAEQIEKTEYRSISIFCHDQPDPDCLASAMAVAQIAHHYGKKPTIYYGGEIGHTQNRIMVNVLDISAIKLDADDEEETLVDVADAIKDSFVIVVDTAFFGSENCQGVKAFVDLENSKSEPDLVIDHHELNPKLNCSYLRKSYGSCSTILYEMLKSLEIPVGKILATALYLGIETDTASLKSEGATQEDQIAFEELKEKIDFEKYFKVFNYPKPSALLDLRKRAYDTIQTSSMLAVASVGVITPQQRSLVAELCEEIVEIESIETAVVMAIVDEGLKSRKCLTASFRSGLLAINTKDFMNKIFGKKGVGGRKGAGGATIPLDFIHCDTIDSIRSQHGDNGHLSQYVNHIFEAYATKIREEKENV